jgi:deoxyhypusine synthase
MNTKAVAEYVRHHYRHFNSAALIDAADGYIKLMKSGGKMMVTLAGAMSTAELGLSLAEMIRRDKVQIITTTTCAYPSTASSRPPTSRSCWTST